MKKKAMIDKYGFAVNHKLSISQKAIYEDLSSKKYYSQSLISQIIANKTGDKICLQDLKQHWWRTTQNKKPTVIESIEFFREILESKEYNMSSVYRNMGQKFPGTSFASEQFSLMYMKKVFSKTIKTVQKLAQQHLATQVLKTTIDQRKRIVKNLMICYTTRSLKKPNILRYFLLHVFLNFLTRKSVPISDIKLIYSFLRDFIDSFLSKINYDQKIQQFTYNWKVQELQKLYKLYVKKHGNLWHVQKSLIRQDCQRQNYLVSYLTMAYYQIAKIGYQKLQIMLNFQPNKEKQELKYSEFKNNLLKVTKNNIFYANSVKIMEIAFDKTFPITQAQELYYFLKKQFGKPESYKKRGRKPKIAYSQHMQMRADQLKCKQIDVKQKTQQLHQKVLSQNTII